MILNLFQNNYLSTTNFGKYLLSVIKLRLILQFVLKSVILYLSCFKDFMNEQHYAKAEIKDLVVQEYKLKGYS